MLYRCDRGPPCAHRAWISKGLSGAPRSIHRASSARSEGSAAQGPVDHPRGRPWGSYGEAHSSAGTAEPAHGGESVTCRGNRAPDGSVPGPLPLLQVLGTGEAGLSQPRTSPGLFTIQWRHVLADLQVRQSRFLPPRSSTSHGGSRILLLSTPKLWHKQRTLKRLSQVCNAEECALPNDYLSKSTNERLRISAERRHERKLRRAGKQAVKLSHPSVGGHALWIMESITPQSFIAEMPQTSWWNLRRLNESLAGKWSWPDRW